MKYYAIIAFTLFICHAKAQENYTLHSRNGKELTVDSLRLNQKKTLVVFWSGYCRQCKLIMKGMSNIGKSWSAEYNTDLVFINLETYPSSAYDAENMRFLKELTNPNTYFLHDENRKFFQSFGRNAIPLTVLYDEQGNIYKQWNSYDDGLERSIGLYLKKMTESMN